MLEQKLQRIAKAVSNPSEPPAEARKSREEFIRLYPKEKWATMTLEEFVIGSGQQTACWWIEFNTPALGSIKGGSSQKFQIYLAKNGEYVYDKDSFDSPSEAWETMRREILEMLNLAGEGRYEELDRESLILYKAGAFRMKLLYLYYPDQFLPIYSINHLDYFLETFAVPAEKWEKKGVVTANRALWKFMHRDSRFKDWDPLVFMRVLYEYFPPNRRYWKIAPGPKASIWQECFQNGYIAVGWTEVGNFTNYSSFDELKREFQKLWYADSPQTAGKKAKELWNFYNLKPGDRVLANDGQARIVGVGTVTDEGYRFRDDLEHRYKNTIGVKWDKDFQPKEIAPQKDWFSATVKALPHQVFMELTTGQPKISHFTPEEVTFFNRMEQLVEQKGQIILYGPPGTGKTYLARKYVEWVQEREEQNAAKDIRFWFMVANDKTQDWRWENILANNGQVDFIHGSIKKNFSAAKRGDLIFCYQTGKQERQVVGLAKVIEELHEDSNGKCITVQGLMPLKIPLEYNDFKEEPAYTESQAGRCGNRGTMFEVDMNLVTLFINMLEKNKEEAAVKEIRKFKVKQDNVELVTFHPSFNYEDFIEGFKPSEAENGQITFKPEQGIFVTLCNRAENDRRRPYFLIIDEINRGNVAKIFGELLTVLEKDKREKVQVRLPQSKSWFSVPPNVYIIATMNTADRSIKLLDAALKRRFVFVEILPDPKLLDVPVENTNLTLADIMNVLNAKLREFVGRDKQIGHAYFMRNGAPVVTIDELKQIYHYEIIPLIQEYCYDNYQQLADIVGIDFVNTDIEEISDDLFTENDDDFTLALINSFSTQR